MGLESRPENGFFRLDPDAKYNDGVPVKAVDFMWWVYLHGASDNVVTLWSKQYIQEQWSQCTVWRRPDCDFSSRAQTQARLLRQLASSAPHFYKEYGPDYRAINGSAAHYRRLRSSRRTWSRVFPSLSAGWTTGGPPTRNSTVTVSTRTISAIRW